MIARGNDQITAWGRCSLQSGTRWASHTGEFPWVTAAGITINKGLVGVTLFKHDCITE